MFKFAQLAGMGAGEGAFFVTEEFGVDEVGVKAAAV